MMTKVDEREPMRFEQDVLDLAVESLRARHGSGLAPAPRRPRRRRRAMVAIAAAGLAIAIAIPIALPGGVTGGADPAAAALLHRVALRAAQQPPDSAPGPGQYLYTRSESTFTLLYVVGDGSTFLFRTPNVREFWVSPDGSGRILNTPGAVTFPTEGDRAAWIAAGMPHLSEWVTDEDADDEFDRFAPGELTFENHADLPTDPEALLELIESRELIGGPGGDWETFSIVGDLLRQTYTSPKVRAALYQVVAGLPGVELVGRVVDGAGRPGVAVAYTNPSSDARSRLELIFDPKTTELLEEGEVLVADSTVDVESGGPGAIYGGVGPAGTRTYSSTYLASGVVESTSETL
jgi:catechol 2,3-dioxygenase-like lactoylglutathione lyase family enzyme